MSRTLPMLVLVLGLAVGACSKEPSLGPPAPIVDLSTSVADLRQAFDAHRGEARFVTLLSPT